MNLRHRKALWEHRQHPLIPERIAPFLPSLSSASVVLTVLLCQVNLIRSQRKVKGEGKDDSCFSEAFLIWCFVNIRNKILKLYVNVNVTLLG